MKFYYSLYYMIDEFIELFDGLYYFHFEYERTLLVTFMIVIIQTFSLVVLMPNIMVGNNVIVSMALITIANYLLFVHKSRYKKVLELCNTKPPNLAIKSFWVLYILVTMVLYFFKIIDSSMMI